MYIFVFFFALYRYTDYRNYGSRAFNSENIIYTTYSNRRSYNVFEIDILKKSKKTLEKIHFSGVFLFVYDMI